MPRHRRSQPPPISILRYWGRHWRYFRELHYENTRFYSFTAELAWAHSWFYTREIISGMFIGYYAWCWVVIDLFTAWDDDRLLEMMPLYCSRKAMTNAVNVRQSNAWLDDDADGISAARTPLCLALGNVTRHFSRAISTSRRALASLTAKMVR